MRVGPLLRTRLKAAVSSLASGVFAASIGLPVSTSLTLAGTPPPAIVGVPYSFTPIRVNGKAPFTFALAGSLPAGLTFSTSTGIISGTPTAVGITAGLNISVTDSTPLTVSMGVFSLVVGASGAPAALAISGTPGAPQVGVPYSFVPTAAGGVTPYTFTLTGNLPAGLSFSTATGAITGTPTAAGTSSGLSIGVAGSGGQTASLGPFNLVVAAAAGASPAAGDRVLITRAGVNFLALPSQLPLAA